MNTYYNADETMLSEIYGGNSGGAAVVTALGCAAGGVKYGKFLGPWGAAMGGIGGALICGYLAYSATS